MKAALLKRFPSLRFVQARAEAKTSRAPRQSTEKTTQAGVGNGQEGIKLLFKGMASRIQLLKKKHGPAQEKQPVGIGNGQQNVAGAILSNHSSPKERLDGKSKVCLCGTRASYTRPGRQFITLRSLCIYVTTCIVCCLLGLPVILLIFFVVVAACSALVALGIAVIGILEYVVVTAFTAIRNINK